MGIILGLRSKDGFEGGFEGNFLRNGTLEEVEDLNVKFGS